MHHNNTSEKAYEHGSMTRRETYSTTESCPGAKVCKPKSSLLKEVLSVALLLEVDTKVVNRASHTLTL